MTRETQGGLIGAGVLAALGVLLFGLILPGISKMREAARRAQCTGHFKQLALGLHNYESVYSRLPPGSLPLDGVPPERRLSWAVAVLPYIEQGLLFTDFERTVPADHPTNLAAGRTGIWQFVCPSSAEYRTLRGKPSNSVLPTLSLTHVAGVAGVGDDAATVPKDHPRAGAMGFDWQRPLNRIGFSDGVSNTLLLMEVGSDPGPWSFGGPGTLRGVEPDATPVFGPAQAFGGFHAGTTTWFRRADFGCNAALADGSVRFFHRDTDPAVLAALATAGGGEPTPIE